MSDRTVHRTVRINSEVDAWIVGVAKEYGVGYSKVLNRYLRECYLASRD
jgi:hypothetical protein